MCRVDRFVDFVLRSVPYSLRSAMTAGLILLVCPVHVGAEMLTSSFDHFVGLSVEQENALGVITPPDSAKQVATHRGVPILETSRSFSQAEIEQIKYHLDKVPSKMLETPPKAIIAASKETKGRVVRPNTIATASGPYIFLGDGFFQGGFRSTNTANDKVSIFMHEYAHVLQYYHLDKVSGTLQTMRDRSSLTHSFAIDVGWQIKDPDNKGQFLSGDAIPFLPAKSSHRWHLPEDQEAGTTRYGRTNTLEDQAESFGWVIAGHPGLLSPQRVAHVSNYLGEEAQTFIKGVIPIHPDAKRARSQPRGSKKFFQAKTSKELTEKLTGPEYFHFFDDDAEVDFETVKTYFEAQFQARGYSTVQPMTHEVLENKEDYARAVYSFDEGLVLLQIVDFANAENYITKGGMMLRMAEGIKSPSNESSATH